MFKKTYVVLTGFLVVAAVGGLLALSAPVITGNFLPGAVKYDDFIASALILVFGYVALRLLGTAIISYGAGKTRMDERSVARVVTIIGYAILILFVMSAFRINFTGIIVGAGFLGIVIGLASQSTLGNFFAGITMMAARPFAIGDRITFTTWQYGMMPPSYAHHTMLPGYSGTIEDIGLMYTRIKLDDGPSAFVPNGVINQAAIINYSISEFKDVIIRVELVKRNVAAFRKRLDKLVAADRKLQKIIGGKVDLLVTDIGVSNYGIRLKATVPMGEESYVTEKLSAIALSASEDFQS